MSQPLASQKDSPNRLWSWAISVALLLLGVLGLGLLVFSILGLSGQVATPIGPVQQHLSAADFASSAVAGATLLLAAVTVLLALFTRNSLALGRAELALAEKSLAAVQEQGVKLAEQVTATHVQAAAMQSQAAATQQQAFAMQNQVAATQQQAGAMQNQAAATQQQAFAMQNQAAATQQQAAIAQQTLEASWRPLLVDVPFGFATRRISSPGSLGPLEVDVAPVEADKRQDGVVRVIVPFRNIGSGPAVISRAVMSFGQLHTEATAFSSSIVAAREAVRIFFDVAPTGAVPINVISQLDSGRPFTVAVFYGDQGGARAWRSRAQLHRPPSTKRYQVLNVELYEGDATTPFASSGSGAP